MTINLVQPKNEEKLNVNIELVNQYTSTPPANITNPIILSTVPLQSNSSNSLSTNLSSHAISALISQQALYNNTLPDEEKLAKGVLDNSISGITLKQLSENNSVIKPGASEFIKKIKSKYPKLPDKYFLSKRMFTGDNGIKNINDLKNNVNAQLNVISNSINQATHDLTKKGILTGKETFTEVSGIVLAASTLGSKVVSDTLSNIGNIASKVNSNTEIGQIIAGGNYAANLSDKVTSGLSGVLDSLSLNNKNINNNKPISYNAFRIAEQSFGSLKPKTANSLTITNTTDINSALTNLQKTTQEKDLAEKLLTQATKAYKDNPNNTNLLNLRNIEANVNQLEQTLEKAKSMISTNANQFMNSLKSQQINSLNNVNQLVDSQINNINLTAGAFVNNIEQGVSVGITNVKNLVNNASQGVESVIGNLKNNVNKLAETTLATNNIINNNLKNITNQTTNITQNISNNLKAKSAAILGGASALLNGIGKNASKLNIPNMASNTFSKIKSAMNSVFNATLDPKVPVPVFEEITFKVKPKADISNINSKLEELKKINTSIENKSRELSSLYEQYKTQRNGSILNNIDRITNEINLLQSELADAQRDYYNSLI